MSKYKFKFGDRVRYNIDDGMWKGTGIYLGYDRGRKLHVIGCDVCRDCTELRWALYAHYSEFMLLSNESSESFTSPTVQRLEDLLEEL